MSLTGVGQISSESDSFIRIAFVYDIARAKRFCPNYGIPQNIGVSLILNDSQILYCEFYNNE